MTNETEGRKLIFAAVDAASAETDWLSFKERLRYRSDMREALLEMWDDVEPDCSEDLLLTAGVPRDRGRLLETRRADDGSGS